MVIIIMAVQMVLVVEDMLLRVIGQCLLEDILLKWRLQLEMLVMRVPQPVLLRLWPEAEDIILEVIIVGLMLVGPLLILVEYIILLLLLEVMVLMTLQQILIVGEIMVLKDIVPQLMLLLMLLLILLLEVLLLMELREVGLQEVQDLLVGEMVGEVLQAEQ